MKKASKEIVTDMYADAVCQRIIQGFTIYTKGQFIGTGWTPKKAWDSAKRHVINKQIEQRSNQLISQ